MANQTEKKLQSISREVNHLSSVMGESTRASKKLQASFLELNNAWKINPTNITAFKDFLGVLTNIEKVARSLGVIDISLEDQQTKRWTAELKAQAGALEKVIARQNELNNLLGRVKGGTTMSPAQLRAGTLGSATPYSPRTTFIESPTGITESALIPMQKFGRETKLVSGALREAEVAVEKLLRATSKLEGVRLTKAQIGEVGAFAGKYGMGIGDLTSVKKDEASGGIRMKFANEELGSSIDVVRNKMGDLRTVSSGLFKNMAQKVGKNIAEFTKWSVAISAVYVPLQFLGEQMSKVVDIQDEMADVAIVLTDVESGLAEVFKASADIADLTSSSLLGVIEGYNLAIRSISNFSSESERLVKAQALLTNSLILSKLAGIDQAKATDLLVASQKQINDETVTTESLLNLWVSTSKEANVSVDTLATSYSIMASVAKSAGIEVGGANDQLAGLVAVLAEATPKSAVETANALRTIVSGFTTDSAQKELLNLGIAVNTLEGDFVGFYELASEVNKLFEAGIITEAQLGAVARAVGGGTRRQADVEAILKNLDRVKNINKIEVQDNAAFDALQIKTDTLSSAFTELKNAVIELGQTLGNEGGFLDTLTKIVDALSWMIDKLEKLTSLAGSSTLPLLATALAPIIAGGFGKSPVGALQSYGKNTATNPEYSDFRRGVGGLVDRKASTIYGVGMAAAAVGTTAVSNISQGKEGQALGNVVGGLAGGFLGALTGNPALIGIGAAIGSSVGEGFVSYVTLEGVTVGSAIYDLVFKEEQAKRGITPDVVEESPETVERNRTEELSTALAKALAPTAMTPEGEKIWQSIVNANARGVASSRAKAGETEGITVDSVIAKAVQILAPEAWAAISEEYRTPVVDDLDQQLIAKQFSPIIASIQGDLRDSLRADLLAGDITSTDYVNREAGIQGAGSLVQQLLTTQGVTSPKDTIDVGGTSTTVSAWLDDILETVINASPDEQSLVATLSASYNALSLAMKENVDGVVMLGEEEMTMAEARKKQASIQQSQIAAIEQFAIRQAREDFTAPSIVNAQKYDLGGGGMEAIIALAQEMQASKDRTIFAELEQPVIDAIVGDREGFAVQTSPTDFTSLGAMGLEVDVFAAALAEGAKEGIIQGVKETQNLGLTQTGLTSEQFDAAQPFYDALMSQLVSLNYTPNEEPQILVHDDGMLEAVEVDMAVIQLLLGGIEENTEKMVDGIYNLPTDGTFYVPFTGYREGYNNAGGGGNQDLIDFFKTFFTRGGALDAGSYELAPANSTQAQMQAQMKASAEAFTGYEASSYQSGHLNTDTLRAMGVEGLPQDENPWDNVRGYPSSHLGTDTLQNKFGLELPSAMDTQTTESGTMVKMLDKLSSGFDAMSNPKFSVDVEISAMFRTFLDGAVLAEVNKKYATSEFEVSKTSSGLSLSATI